MKRTVFCIALFALCFSLFSCSGEVRAEHCELGILLPRGFDKKDTDGVFDVVYSDGELTVGITRISYASLVDEGISPTLSPRAFAELYKRGEGIDKTVHEYGDTVYYTYTLGSERYLPTFYRTPYAYFIITFAFAEGGAWDIEGALELTNTVYLIAS